MPPIYVKGGVWTNVEDEILKAAVQKYGLNQWNRVGSLLTKKNAKQAKARWNEWISPSINKTEWTREEDEKLLNLVKLLPNQWRSIAPIMNRTATHCVERYQKLLDDDDEQSEDDENDLRLAAVGVEAMPAAGGRVGDLNLNPESKPAKPDDEELEDADREMLFEARARLANTKGKKAKRRHRERMLEETKRISLLQKRRELKAAGINVSLVSKNKKKSKEFDYNADIPFEHQPQIGLYDTTEEHERNEEHKAKFSKQVSREGLELEKLKQSKKRKQGSQIQEPRTQLEGEANVIEPALKRGKLSLPGVVNVDEHAEFEPTELTGVFDRAVVASAEDDIDRRIANTTHHIKANQAKQSVLLRTDHETDEDVAVKKWKPKHEKKAIQELVKVNFSRLPAPNNEYEVLPKFNDQDDFQLVKTADSHSETQRIKRLELLRQVEEEKAKSRRSQVVQRGLAIPSPSLLKPIDTTQLSELDSQVAVEFHALVKSDYKKYVDTEYNATEIPELDEQLYSQVHREIDEMRSKKTTLHPAVKRFRLPDPISYKDEILSVLQHARQQHLGLKADINAQIPYSSAPREVAPAGELIIEQERRVELYTQIAQQEEVSIVNRSATLKGLVDMVVAKEDQLIEYLRQ
ncbi:Pre-mRNA-splicing factor cef1 [Yamadazyma tenuis]|uniref:Pre-mRNA-splicing factor CEF1 n=1 Tax=Candida tenuis (strain ATCC 10573 / BCRC 21748 / CBS 615 / JCM 9827 / NBRC 10315 / NRRL Y-1498 / VKM Y-70) TaxID=590646 RepID=G3BER5_CANTC|nr:uncharacterized protein CANTEDRAFT_127944 [Yamadazyma tenuis ATCC 10573]EGV60574.1 hypothetical protein CANTEDRAFT_127944 [Yamadazyma tenuis ATCC 10573]WEJ94178.1 Pre-mRNA-splicing factor cef1 [Yamadazyma tenuis]